MKNKFLLYIDILGFSELVSSEERVRDLYEVIDSLNAHDHDVFSTIVFSDTILVYNKKPPANRETAEYIVWYATEFVEDLHFRLIGKDIYFRAYLSHGEFDHYTLKNTECFFGRALVDAYNNEKTIQSTGLFIDEKCLDLLRFFDTERFDDKRHFVYLERTFKTIEEMSFGELPLKRDIFCDGENVPFLIEATHYIREIHRLMREHSNPVVRQKYLTTWDFYQRKYKQLLDHFVANNFSHESLCPEYNWDRFNS